MTRGGVPVPYEHIRTVKHRTGALTIETPLYLTKAGWQSVSRLHSELPNVFAACKERAPAPGELESPQLHIGKETGGTPSR